MQEEIITQETVLEKVRQRLSALQGNAEQAVAEALAILNDPRQTIPPRTEESFIGTNVSFSQYTVWSPEERFQYLNSAKKANARWIEQQFQKLNADWFMVIDGQVVAYNTDVQKLPRKQEFVALCQKYEKYPFVFFNPRVFFIEETTGWHATSDPEDTYPTVKVNIRDEQGSLALEADFDTGAKQAYCDLNLLLKQGFSIFDSADYEEESIHLSRNFRFIPTILWYSVQDKIGKTKEVEFLTFCIKNWRASPFVVINPNRTALVGRGLFHKLAPVVHLDFAARQTEIEFHDSIA